LIDMWEWKGILRTMFVESGTIDTYATHVCVFLGDQHWVGNPSRCFDFLDEPNIFFILSIAQL
jgi:hypothetical protein